MARRVAVFILLVLVAVLAIVPLLWAFAASFTPVEKVFLYAYPFSWRALFPVDFTVEAYRALFSSGFGRSLVNTLTVGLATVVVGGTISGFAGFAFGRFEFPGRDALFALVMLIFALPGEVTTIPLYILVSRLGWINTWQVLIVPSLASSLMVFLFRQFFAEIPQDLIDAARVDGASWLTVFAKIILPVSQPVLVTASLLLFLGQWNSFFWPLLVAPTPEMRVVQVAISFAVEEHRTVWNELLAGSMLAAVVPIALVLPFQRYYISGIIGTGLKE